MAKETNFDVQNKYSFLDAFKCFLYLLLVTAGVSLIFQIVLAIISGVSGRPYNELLVSDTVTILQYILNPVIMIVFYLVFNKIKKVNNKFALSDGQKISLLPISIALVLSIIAIFLFTPFMNLIDYGFMRLGYVADNSIPLNSLITGSVGGFFLGLVLFALLPAIAEEFIFRGIIQKGVSTKINGFGTILLTAILFTLMHGALQQTVYQFIMGIMLSYVSYVGGSVLYSIILHFMNNTFVLLFSSFDIVGYLSNKNTVYYNVFGMIFPFLLFLLGCVLVAILFWVLKYLRNKNFFRYDPKKKKKVKVKASEIQEPEKIKMAGIWKNSSYVEKVFLLCSFVLVGLIWLINTINNFM